MTILPAVPNAAPLLLGVSSSFCGRPWRSRIDKAGESRAFAFVQMFGLSDILSRVMVGRGVAIDFAVRHLDPSLRNLMPDPSCLQGLDAAVARLAQAVAQKECVGIFGDYDVDGAASAALLAGYLAACGVPYLIHIPDRITEGYGPNIEAIGSLAAQGARLLVCVDCGTTSHAAMAAAQRLGLDPLILDHHQAPELLPDAVVVNPNRQDCLSGLGHLCAAGVVFMVLAGLNRYLRQKGFWPAACPEPDLIAGLDLVAFATVADVASLTGLNRAFVVKGLTVLRGRGRPGLAALIDAAGLSGPPEAWHLGFLLGPRINAGGRIGDAALGARLMLESDPVVCAKIAAELDRLNTERRAIEKATVDEAEAQALAEYGPGAPPCVVIAKGDDWHPGIVGLVASRLKESFARPAFALAFTGETGVGSGRSIPGVDLGSAVRAAAEAGVIVKGGGHAMAAGVTLTKSQLRAFRAFLETRLSADVAAAGAGDALLIDAALSAGGATRDLVADIARAGPFGAGNPEPVFVLPAHRILDVQAVGTEHLRIRAQARDGAKIEAMAFRAAASPLGQGVAAARGESLHLAVTLSIDHWRGREKVNARLVDAARAV